MITAKILLKQAIRELESSSADMIQIIYHDGRFKLNDVGEIAIPSRSLGSISIDKDPYTNKVKNRGWYLNEIKDFIQKMQALEDHHGKVVPSVNTAKTSFQLSSTLS